MHHGVYLDKRMTLRLHNKMTIAKALVMYKSTYPLFKSEFNLG
jgi:hypothetical protein